MPETVTIRGRYENRTFIPSEPLPGVEGEAELIVTPTAMSPQPVFQTRPRPTPEEFRALLKELTDHPPYRILPADFSREDIYEDDEI